MIKIATIEDEENIRQEIVRYIKKGIGSIEGVEVDVYESAERYLLVGGRYDLVISDIELPGISGLELGKRIKENNPDVYLVFLTSHSEFASESYIIEAYQYILKKDIEERLDVAESAYIFFYKRNYSIRYCEYKKKRREHTQYDRTMLWNYSYNRGFTMCGTFQISVMVR